MRDFDYRASSAADLPATLVWTFFAAGIALSPVGDFLSIVASQAGGEGRFSLLVRGGMIAGFLLALILSGRVSRSGGAMIALALLSISGSAVSYALAGMTGKEFVNQAVFIFKVFSFFIGYAALSRLPTRRLDALRPLIGVVLFVYAAAIIAGALLSIDLFRSYQAQTHIRAGYKGIVYAQNEASALLIVGLAYVYLQALKTGWKRYDKLLLASLFCASFLLGTKGAVVGALGVTVAYLYARHSVLGATWRASVVIGLLAVVAIGAYIAIEPVRDAVDLTIRYFQYHYDHASGDGLLTILLSGRDVKFATVWADLAQQDYISLLTGGYPVVRYQVEIDVPDLILALGLPVFALYIVTFAAHFVRRGGTRVARFGMLFFIVLIAVACSAGHVLVSALIGPYLAVIAVAIRRGATDTGARAIPRLIHE